MMSGSSIALPVARGASIAAVGPRGEARSARRFTRRGARRPHTVGGARTYIHANDEGGRNNDARPRGHTTSREEEAFDGETGDEASALSGIRFRRGEASDLGVIAGEIFKARMNPLGLDHGRFIVAVDEARDGQVVGFG